MSSFKTKLKFDRKKLFIILLCSLIFIVALTSVLLAITNNNKDKENKNTQTNYEHKINDLYDVITDRNNEINNLNAQIDSLNTDIKKLNNTLLVNESDISTLTSLKNDLDKQVKVLTATKLENETTISECQLKITNLTVERDSLNEKDLHNTEMITNLNTQINNLQVFVNQLQNTNAINSNTINSLTNQIVSLNSRINDLTLSMQENINQLAVLNSQINDLENSIKYYETYVNNLATNGKCVVTFYFNGSVYNIQVVNKGSKVQVVNPADTNFVKFNYWYMNLSDNTTKEIDLSTETFSENTKIQANITRSYSVYFLSDWATLYNSQIVENNKCASVPVAPTKSGYTFVGWSTNGVDIISNIDTIKVKHDIWYYAVFKKLYTVKFIDDDNVVSTQTICSGNYANVPSINTETYKAVQQRLKDLGYYSGAVNGVFGIDSTSALKSFQTDKGLTANGNVDIDTLKALELTTFKQYSGWKVNENLVDVATYKIVEDTTFVSDYTLYIQTIFSIDGVNVSQYVQQTKTATAPSVTSSEHKVFKGWFVNDEKVDVANYPITKTTTFTAKFDIYYDVIFQVDDTEYNKQLILSGNCATVPTNPTKEDYGFIGWSIDGENVINEDISTIQVSSNTTYISIFKPFYTVTFMNDNKIVDSQQIGSDGFIEYTPSVTENISWYDMPCKFKGWTLDNCSVIDFNSFVIDKDYTFNSLYACSLSGLYEGTLSNGTYSINYKLYITETGMGYFETNYSRYSKYNDLWGYIQTVADSLVTTYGLYSLTNMGSYDVYIVSVNENLSLNVKVDNYTGILTRISDYNLSKNYLIGEYYLYEFNGYCYTKNGFLTEKGTYEIVDNNIYFRKIGFSLGMTSYTFEINDTSIIIGGTVYKKYINSTYVKSSDFTSSSDIDSTGNLISNVSGSMALTELKIVKGISITQIKESTDVSYRVIFYNQNKEFISTTEKLSGNFDVNNIPTNSEYFRVVIYYQNVILFDYYDYFIIEYNL